MHVLRAVHREGILAQHAAIERSAADNVTPLTWGLREVLQYAEVLLNKDDIDAKADALIDFISERVVDRKMDREGPLSRDHTVQSFGDLEAWFRDLLQGMERANMESWRTHHIATIRKVRNRLSNISTRCAGLVTDTGDVSDLPFGSFEDRSVYVVDVASLEEDAQDLIFARIVSKLREHLERRDLGVKHLIVFVDELNKYAPGDGQDTYVRKMLLDIAERGRYLGLVLFSAQQFRSQVHRRVVGNSGTALYGRMDCRRARDSGIFGAEPRDANEARDARERAADGSSSAFHAADFRAIPASGGHARDARVRSGFRRRRSDDSRTRSIGRCATLDPAITLAWVQKLVALYDEEELLRARNATLLAKPANVRAFFESRLRSIIPAEPVGSGAAAACSALRPLPIGDPYGDVVATRVAVGAHVGLFAGCRVGAAGAASDSSAHRRHARRADGAEGRDDGRAAGCATGYCEHATRLDRTRRSRECPQPRDR